MSSFPFALFSFVSSFTAVQSITQMWRNEMTLWLLCTEMSSSELFWWQCCCCISIIRAPFLLNIFTLRTCIAFIIYSLVLTTLQGKSRWSINGHWNWMAPKWIIWRFSCVFQTMIRGLEEDSVYEDSSCNSSWALGWLICLHVPSLGRILAELLLYIKTIFMFTL